MLGVCKSDFWGNDYLKNFTNPTPKHDNHKKCCCYDKLILCHAE